MQQRFLYRLYKPVLLRVKVLYLDQEIGHQRLPALVVRVSQPMEVSACLGKSQDGWHVALFDDGEAELFGETWERCQERRIGGGFDC